MLDIIVTNVVIAIITIITRFSTSLNSVDLLKVEFASTTAEYMIHDLTKLRSLIRLILRVIWANFGTGFHDGR